MRNRGPFEIHTPTHWNLIGRCACHRPAVFFRHLSYCAFVLKKGKVGALLKNVFISIPFFISWKVRKVWNCVKSGSGRIVRVWIQCRIFNDSFSKQEHKPLHRVIGWLVSDKYEKMWKSWKFQILFCNFPEWTVQNHKNIGQYSRCLSIDLNPVPPNMK